MEELVPCSFGDTSRDRQRPPSSSFKTRVIYCYTAPNSSDHIGLVKVGDVAAEFPLGLSDAERDALARSAAKRRIHEQTNTSGLATVLHWAKIAPYLQMKDHRVHDQLESAGIENVKPGDSNAREWFRTTPEEAGHITDVTFAGYSPNATPGGYALREEQEVFAQNALSAWASGAGKRLWDAKMRFGKTLTALEFVGRAHQMELEGSSAERQMRRVLILTHRPVVNGAWFEEFTKVLAREDAPYFSQGWQYASKALDVTSRRFDELDRSKPFIYFASLQDLRGQEEGADGAKAFKETNREIFGTDWDMVLIDEAHEGNRTGLAQDVHAALRREFTLYLSGTPYKYFADSEFLPEEMDCWDYGMEQERKFSWDEEHPDKDNPYAVLPQMWIYALDMADTFRDKYEAAGEAVAFDFREMFKTTGSGSRAHFERASEIEEFLSSLVSPEPHPLPAGGGEIHMPFAEGGPAHRHTLWVLPTVNACNAMKAALGEHSAFSDYEVVNVAGSGDVEANNAAKKVKSAIEKHERTITLTVGRLTTGVTIPEWTAVLMLSNLTAAESYMQTIFRTQSPHRTEDGAQKTECFVYDFAPDRVLQVLSSIAGAVTKAGRNQPREASERLTVLLNYLPVISRVDARDFRRMDAGEITRAIKRVYRERVVDAGFDSDLLFVKDLSGLPEEIRKAIEDVRVATGNNTPAVRTRPTNSEIPVAVTGVDQKTIERIDEEIEQREKTTRRERTEEEQAELDRLKTERDARQNMRYVLRTISVRIPLLVLGLMSEGAERVQALKEHFTLSQFVDLIDDTSWEEYFQSISKETVLSLEPVFDADVLQVAVRGWVDSVEAALALRKNQKYEEYATSIAALLGKVKNPNKETVFTPWPVVQTVYQAAGFPGDPGSPTKTRQTWTVKKQPATFYDINIKSGLFPLYAALNIAQANPDRTWERICDESIYGNARTPAGKWITCTLLGKPRDWANITVIDVHAELQSPDLKGLNDQQKQDFVAHFLTAPLRAFALLGPGERKTLTADITDMAERNTARKKVTEENPGTLADVRFDHVISNPPYQVVQNEETGKANPIWQHFVWLGANIGRRAVLINPARWQKGGSGTGLVQIKKWLLSTPHLEVVYNISNEDSFPSATIEGGVSIEVIDSGKRYDYPKLGEWSKADSWSPLRRLAVTDLVDIPLPEVDMTIVSAIRNAYPDSVEQETWAGGEGNLTKRITSKTRTKPTLADYSIMSTRMFRDTDYFVSESEKLDGVEYVTIWYLEKNKSLARRYLPTDELQDNERNRSRLGSWNVLIPKTHCQMIYRNLGPLAEPGALCTPSWVCRSFPSKRQASNYQTYLRTYFYRYLLTLRRVSQNAYVNVHRFVPDLAGVKNPRTGKIGYNSTWTDDDLVALFDGVLTPADWRHIKATAIAADKGRGDYEAGWTFPDGSTHKSLTIVE